MLIDPKRCTVFLLRLCQKSTTLKNDAWTQKRMSELDDRGGRSFAPAVDAVHGENVAATAIAGAMAAAMAAAVTPAAAAAAAAAELLPRPRAKQDEQKIELLQTTVAFTVAAALDNVTSSHQ